MSTVKYAVLSLLLACYSNFSIAQNDNQTIDSLLIVLKTANEDTTKVNILNRLSTNYRLNKQVEKAKIYADSAFMLADKIGFKRGKGTAYYRIGLCYFDNPGRDIAIKNFLAALEIYEEIGFKPGIIDVYFSLGNININKSDYKEALKYHQLALMLKQESGANKKDIVTSLNNIGLVYYSMGNYIESAKTHMQALNIRREIGDISGLVGSLINLGGIYYVQGNYPEALKYFLEALRISEQNSFKQFIADCSNNIGLIYHAQKNYKEALKNYNASLNFNKETGSKFKIAQNYINIGNVYDEQSDFTEAMNAYQTALKYYEESGSKSGIAGCYNNIGMTFNKQKNYKEAYKYVSASLKIFEEIGNKRGVAGKLMNIGSIFSEQAAFEKRSASDSMYSESLLYINKSLPVAKEIKAMGLIKDIYELLAITHERMKDYRKALEYKNLFIEYKDSLISDETARKLEQQRTQYEVEKAIAEGKTQKEKALTEERIANEKKLADERLLQEKKMADERTRYELLTAQDKYLYELALANERTEQEKIKAEEQLKKEQALAEEKYKSGLVLATTKAEQEKEKTAIKRRNELLLAGAGMLLVSLVFIFLYQRQRTLKQRAIEKAEAGHKMTELELQSLRAQLNPHFMFNSLNAIQELILMEDNERSHTYLSRFSKLIRMLLDNASQPFIPLRKEIEFLELYLSLEKLRIPDLQYTIEIDPGIDTGRISVPNMMLQPYIENAIWHGLSPKTSDKKLSIRIHLKNGTVQYEIEDNGIGRKKAAELKSLYRKEHKSKGMELLTKRFKLLSEELGSEIRTTMTDLSDKDNEQGTRVTISVPNLLSGIKKVVTI